MTSDPLGNRPHHADSVGLLDSFPTCGTIALAPVGFLFGVFVIYGLILLETESWTWLRVIVLLLVGIGVPVAVGLLVKSRNYGPWRGTRVAVWFAVFWAPVCLIVAFPEILSPF